MFGLYPAGPDWVRHFDSKTSAREVQGALVKHGGFLASISHEPFGTARGSVLARKDSFLVMSHLPMPTDEEWQLVVVPGVEMQNLLWSFNTGYASQWSAREIRALTGCSGWDDLLRTATSGFADVCELVAKAVEGLLPDRVAPSPAFVQNDVASGAAVASPVGAPPSLSRQLDLYDDAPCVPSDYLHDVPMEARP